MCQPGKPIPHLPQSKVGCVALASEIDAVAAIDVLAAVIWGELAVVVDLARVEVHAIVGRIRDALFFEHFDKVDLLLNRIGRPQDRVRPHDVQQVGVGKEQVGVLVRNVPCGGLFGRGLDLELVLTIVAVAHQVANVGDVHDRVDAVARQSDRAAQQIREQVRPHVPDVRFAVDRWTAEVQLGRLAIGRNKGFGRSRHGVVQRKGQGWCRRHS